MLCSNCGMKEANFHYKYMNNGTVSEVHLCQECARELGYINDNEGLFNMNLGDFFGDFFSVPQFAPSKTTMMRCPECGTTFDTVKRTGFLGCDKCYEAFAKPIETMLSKIQPSTVHKGRLSGTDGKKIERENELKSLKEQLKRAIIDENYEDAAVIRDKIKAFEEREDENNG